MLMMMFCTFWRQYRSCYISFRNTSASLLSNNHRNAIPSKCHLLINESFKKKSKIAGNMQLKVQIEIKDREM